MARDDLFRRSFEAGTAFLEMTRERAEALVKELVKAGEVRKGKAQKLIDEVVERSRKSTEDLRQMIRREIADLGLATKDDIARLESRLEALGPSSGQTPASHPAPTKAPPVKRAGSSRKAAKTDAPAKKGTAAKRAKKSAAAPPVAPAAAAGGTPPDNAAPPAAEEPSEASSGGPPPIG